MANQEQLDILKQGVDIWNAWRRQHPEWFPQFMGIDLNNARLSRANLINAYLNGTHLNYANLSGADLRGAQLRETHLIRAESTSAAPILATLTLVKQTSAMLASLEQP